jgi:hypothetical protein
MACSVVFVTQHCTPLPLPQVGVFTGYSSLAVALALPPDGRLVAFDRDAKTMAVAQKYWQLAGVADKVRGHRISSGAGPNTAAGMNDWSDAECPGQSRQHRKGRQRRQAWGSILSQVIDRDGINTGMVSSSSAASTL